MMRKLVEEKISANQASVRCKMLQWRQRSSAAIAKEKKLASLLAHMDHRFRARLIGYTMHEMIAAGEHIQLQERGRQRRIRRLCEICVAQRTRLAFGGLRGQTLRKRRACLATRDTIGRALEIAAGCRLLQLRSCFGRWRFLGCGNQKRVLEQNNLEAKEQEAVLAEKVLGSGLIARRNSATKYADER